MAATLEAMLDLVHGHREREAIVGEVSAWVLREIGKTPGRQGRALLLKSIADHPRMTMLSLQHRWAQTLWRRFKRRLSTELSSLAALAYATRRRALEGRDGGYRETTSPPTGRGRNVRGSHA